MGFFTDIQIALDSRLNTLTGSTDIAWENDEYVPVIGTPYLRPTLLPAQSSLAELDSTQSNSGIYQIDVFYPTGKGNADALAKCDAIYDHFVAQSLTAGTNTIDIRDISISRTNSRDNAWTMFSVEIAYQNYNT